MEGENSVQFQFNIFENLGKSAQLRAKINDHTAVKQQAAK